MKLSKKSAFSLLLALALILASLTAGIITVSADDAQSDIEEYDEYEVSVETVSAATMRIPYEVEDVASGIRFHTIVDAEKIEQLQAAGCTVETGTLIAPKDRLGRTGLKFINKAKLDVPFDISLGYYNDENEIVGTIANIKQTSDWNDISGNVGRYFVGRGYVKVTDTDGVVHTYYSPTVCERSLKYVANEFRYNDENADIYSDDSLKSLVDNWAESLYVDRTNKKIAANTERYDGGETKMIAHRGHYNNNTGATENSITAYIQAGEVGYWGAECDVHYTSDGKFVISHDSSTARTGNKSLIIENSTFDEVRQVFLLDGSRIPTLVEYLDICKTYSMHPVIEIKNSNWALEHLENLLKEVDENADLNEVVFIGFDRQNLINVKAILDESYPDKTVKLQDLNNVPSDYMAYFEQAKADGVDIDTCTELTLEHVLAAQEMGLEVNVWTKTSVSTWLKRNVDYISGEGIVPKTVQNGVDSVVR